MRNQQRTRLKWVAAAGLFAGMLGGGVSAQHPPGQQGSTNLRIVSHVPLGQEFHLADVELEQELARPYAYVSRRASGFTIISIANPARAQRIYSWTIRDPELHVGSGAVGASYIKTRGRYYFVQSFQFQAGGPDADLGALVFDVTGLPDTSTIREVAQIRVPEYPGGFHEQFAYKHSTGRPLLFATTVSTDAHVYDIDAVVGGGPGAGLVAKVPLPGPGYGPGTPDAGAPALLARAIPGYHDFYVGYDPASRQDRLYGGAAGGYFIFDITDLAAPRLLTSITGVAGVPFGHTISPTPDGRFAVTETEYQYAPLRIFDLKPGLDGQVKTISRPIGAWTARWRGLPHNTEMRWPYLFVATYEDGLHVVNMMDPTNPYSVAFYDTYDGPHERGAGAATHPLGRVFNGAFGVDIRNADGLIVVSDHTTGFWVFRMDGFDGWNGHQWGMPNNSSAQDWDHGPDGAPATRRVSTRS